MPIQDFKLDTGLQVTGSTGMQGALSVSSGITGTLYGTASYGQDANLLDGLDSSVFANLTASNIFTNSQIVSGNLTVTASLSASELSSSAFTASHGNLDYLDFVPLAVNPTQQTGRLFVDNTTNELNYWSDVTNVNLLLGQQLVLRAKCTAMATFTKGQVVRVNGGQGANATFVTASWEDDTRSAETLGFLLNSGVTNDPAYILISGYINDINTNGFTAGQTVYLSSSGQYTNIAPVPPYHEVRLGQVIRVSATVGSIFVRVQNGYELGELHDVYTGSLSVGDLLVYEDGVNGQWTNKKQLTGSYGLTGSLTASIGLSSSLGSFTTVSGTTGVSGSTGIFNILTGSTTSGTLATFGTVSGSTGLSGALGLFTNLTGTSVSGTTAQYTTLTGSTITGSNALYTVVTGTTTTGSTALFTVITGSTITGSTLSYTTLNTTQMTSSGKILVDNNITIGNGNSRISTDIGIGYRALASSNASSNNNVAIGYQALPSNTSGASNVAIGHLAGYSMIGGTSNIFIGDHAGHKSNGNASVAIGAFALYKDPQSGNIFNFAIGNNALKRIESGGYNYCIGQNSGYSLTTGSYNVALGSNTLTPNLDAPNLDANESQSLANNNTAVGHGSLGSLRNANNNTAIGYNSLANNVSGAANTAVGVDALLSNQTGSNSVAIGLSSLAFLVTGSKNISIGYQAGLDVKTGSNNVYIGSYGGVDNVDNNIYLSDGAGNLRLQVDSAGLVSIPGALSLTGNLVVSGNITLGDATTDTITINAATMSLGSSGTGILNIDSNTLYVDGNAGNVGIGAVPSFRLEISGTSGQFPTAFKINPTVDAINGSTRTAILIDNWLIAQDSNGNGTKDYFLRDQVNARTAFLIATNGNTCLSPQAGSVGVGTFIPAHKLDVSGSGRFTSTLTVSGGIAFPAAQAASTNPNTLDDYEEGTWTPALSASTTNSFTHNTTLQSGSYVKIGKKMILNGVVAITATGSSAGNLFITGLPVAIANTNNDWNSMNVGYYKNFATTATSPIGLGVTGSATIQLYKSGAGSGSIMTVTDLTNTSELYFRIDYNI